MVGGRGHWELLCEVHGGLFLNFQFMQVSRSEYKHWRGAGKVQGMMLKDDFLGGLPSSTLYRQGFLWALMSFLPISVQVSVWCDSSSLNFVICLFVALCREDSSNGLRHSKLHEQSTPEWVGKHYSGGCKCIDARYWLWWVAVAIILCYCNCNPFIYM